MAEVPREGLRRGALGSVLFPRISLRTRRRSSVTFPPFLRPRKTDSCSAPWPSSAGVGATNSYYGNRHHLGTAGTGPVNDSGAAAGHPPSQERDSTQIEGASSGDQDNKQDTPKIKLQLDSLGIINFGTGDISLDAYLYDSTIGPFTITEGWRYAPASSKPLFLLSVGGFHPAFQAPAGFPSIERVALGLYKKESGLEVRLQLAAYFALTSNTVQFGAHLDLYVHVWEFEIVGCSGLTRSFSFNRLA